MIDLVTQSVSLDQGGMRAPLLFFSLCFIFLSCESVSQYYLIRIFQLSVKKFRKGIIMQTLGASYAHVERMGKGRILSALSDDINIIAGAAIGVPVLLINFIIVLCGLGHLAMLSPPAMGMGLAAFGLGAVVFHFIRKRASGYFREAREEQDRLFKTFDRFSSGVKELKLNRKLRDAFLDLDCEPSLDRYNVSNTRAFAYFLMAGNSAKLLFFLYVGFLAYLAPLFFSIPAEVLTGCVLTVFFLKGPFEWVLSYVVRLERANVALKKLESMNFAMQAGAEQERPPAENSQLPAIESISLKDATFTYTQESNDVEAFELGPLNLTLNKGEIHFLVGGNGSGKSTLAKLLTGLYSVQSGKLVVNDNITVTGGTIADYREQIAAIFADFQLFPRIMSDVTPEMERQVERILQDLEIAHKVQFKNGQFTTVEQLSMGQKRRLSLVSAYMTERPVFMFDEWTADQDPVLRTVFYQKILPALRDEGKIVIVISHDDKFFYVADQIIRLEYGLRIDQMEKTRGTGLLPRRMLRADLSHVLPRSSNRESALDAATAGPPASGGDPGSREWKSPRALLGGRTPPLGFVVTM